MVGYRGTFAFGRDMSDVKVGICEAQNLNFQICSTFIFFQFRKLSRILVHGKVKMCREVFKVRGLKREFVRTFFRKETDFGIN